MKEKILKLCDDMIIFWLDLKNEIKILDNQDDISNTWEQFFPAHVEIIAELSEVKNMIDEGNK